VIQPAAFFDPFLTPFQRQPGGEEQANLWFDPFPDPTVGALRPIKGEGLAKYGETST
jgi:hypothetical protein